MKPLPPIPPNCEQIPQDVHGNVWFECGNQVVCLNSDPKDPDLDEWRGVAASVAEVAWRKRADYLRGLALGRTTGDSHHAIKSARAWRSWAEPESEEDK